MEEVDLGSSQTTFIFSHLKFAPSLAISSLARFLQSIGVAKLGALLYSIINNLKSLTEATNQ